VTLRVTRGPRADWFEGDAEALTRIRWSVSTETDRVGARLQTDGAALTRVRDGELASEGMVTGALQVPPDGNPVIFLADHPVTGGYPVIATVVDADVAVAAQLPPGTPVRFELI
jgi:allophanate hydrolase subunit 2